MVQDVTAPLSGESQLITAVNTATGETMLLRVVTDTSGDVRYGKRRPVMKSCRLWRVYCVYFGADEANAVACWLILTIR